jgi:hypothetical protein
VLRASVFQGHALLDQRTFMRSAAAAPAPMRPAARAPSPPAPTPSPPTSWPGWPHDHRKR